MTQKLPSVRIFYLRNLLWSSDSDDIAAFVSCFRTEVDNPIGALDHFEIVLNHHDGMTAVDQSLKQLQQHRNVIEVESGGRLVKDKQSADRGLSVCWASDVLRFSQMPD